MLAIYTAILVIAWQHMLDQYSPKILPAFLRHTALWPLVIFGVLLVLSGVLVLHPLQNLLFNIPAQRRMHVSPLVGDMLSFVFLLGSVVTVVWASYNLAQYLADGPRIIAWLHNEEDKQASLQEALQSAVQRSDHRVTVAILNMALSGDLSAQAIFLSWLKDHQDLLSIDWFTRELQQILLSNEFDTDRASTYADVICLLLKRALDEEIFPRAQDVLQSIFDALAHASNVEQAHADLLERMGFVSWKIGETNAYALRSSRIPNQLVNFQNLFVGNMRSLMRTIVANNNQKAMQVFCSALSKLASVTHEGELRGPFFNTIHETLERAFTARLFTLEAINELVSTLGYMQLHPNGYEEATQERIDAIVIDLCAMFVELGGGGERLRNLVEEGGLMARKNKPGGLYGYAHIHSWLKQESYRIVANELGMNDFDYHPTSFMSWGNA